MIDTPSHMEELIHTIDRRRKRKDLPEDVVAILKTTAEIWEVDRGTSEMITEPGGLSDMAGAVCEKYGIVFSKDIENNPYNGSYRRVYSDGTKGDWE